MTGANPRAVGVRRDFTQVPTEVQEWVAAALGAPVVAAVGQVGGMSPGCAARVVTAGGTRAFVKAVGDELNPDTPNLFRNEIRVLARLAEVAYRPSFLASYDDGSWVGLLLEDVEGRHPDLADPADRAAVREIVECQVAELTPAPMGLVTSTFVESATRWAARWIEVTADPERYLPAWSASLVEALNNRVQALPGRVAGSTLCHFDIRNDNLLVRPDGSAVIVDWGMARLGPTWSDPLILALEDVEDASFDTQTRCIAERFGGDDDAFTDLLLGLAGSLLVSAQAPSRPGLPTMSDFQRHEAQRFLAGARRRLEANVH